MKIIAFYINLLGWTSEIKASISLQLGVKLKLNYASYDS